MDKTICKIDKKNSIQTENETNTDGERIARRNDLNVQTQRGRRRGGKKKKNIQLLGGEERRGGKRREEEVRGEERRCEELREIRRR